MAEILLYVVIIALTSWGGYYIKSLSFSGSIATLLVGGSVALGFGWRGLLVLGAFFLSSSLWSKYKLQQKGTLTDILEKGAQRDWIQVLANGSIAAMTAILYYFNNEDIWLVAFLVSIAAANSDTWASEIGVLSKKKPIYILSFKKVERGTSGAVSWLGTVSSLGASIFIAGVGQFLFSFPYVSFFIMITLFGFLGSIIDTLLGATVQAIYRCENCHLTTEKRNHCNNHTVLIKGIKWFNNDVVNVFSIFLATIFSVLFCLFWGY